MVQAAAVAAEARRRLQEYGESFMAMFDDADEISKQNAKRKRAAAPQGQQEENGQGVASRPGASIARRLASSKHAGPGPSSLAVHQDVQAVHSRTRGGESRQQVDDIDIILSGAPSGPSRGQKLVKGVSNAANSSAVPEVTFIDSHRQRKAMQPTGAAPAPALLDIARERKLFMSAKAGKVHEGVRLASGTTRGVKEEDADTTLSRDEFKRLQTEAERLGASALGKKEHKRWKAEMLSRLGAAPDRAPRMAAAIGKGLAAKQAERSKRALEEAMETGMVQRKGRGKKLRSQKAVTRDPGLQELGPGFKAGILRLNKVKKLSSSPGGRSRGRGGIANFNPVRKSKAGSKSKKPRRLPF